MCECAKKIRVYDSKGDTTSFAGSLRLAWEELYGARQVIWHLFVRDFTAGFRQKLLGLLWVVIAPILGIATFAFMHWAGILNPGASGMPYPLYVFMGTGMWGLFISSLSTVSGGLLGNADLVMRTNIPKIAFAITGMANICYNFLVNLVVLLIIFGLYRMPPSWAAVYYPLATLPLIILGTGIGLILAVIGAVARDITSIALTFLNLLMYVTPVIYTAQFEHPLLQFIVGINPLSYLVDTPRSLFVLGTIANPLAFGASSVFALAVLALGIHGFYLIKDKVAERL